MKRLFALVLFALHGTFCHAADLPRGTPESQGVSSSAVLAFVEAADKEIESLNSFMLLRHGHVVAEGWWSPYHAEAKHSLYSLSKSFTSTAVGLAISEGKLRIDDEVLKFFPDEAPLEPSDNLKAMRVSDLLRMSTGHQTEPPRTPEIPWTKSFLTHPVPFKPGTHVLYNTPATYMQSAIVQKVTGTTVLDYLRPRLFEPLGIERPTWEASPQGISTGGFGLSIRTEDIARVGQLYLQKGMWQGKRLVPEVWIDEATARQVSNGSNPSSDWDQGYGYQFWRCRNGGYRGDGAFGQYCIVLPEQDAVIAVTSGAKEMQPFLNLVWDKLLPAMKSSALAADGDATTKLGGALQGLSLRPQEGSATPAKLPSKKYVFPPNVHQLETVTLESNEKENGMTLVMRFDGVEQRIPCGRGVWQKGRGRLGLTLEQPVAASGAWTENDTFTAKLCFYETPFLVTTQLKFAGDELLYHAKTNVGFGPSGEARLLGISGEIAPGSYKLLSAGTNPALSPSPNQSGLRAAGNSVSTPHDFVKWEKEVAAYEAIDRNNPPPKGGVLFIGSSTIRLWKTLAEDFPDHKVINRGIGGSEIVDSTYYADRIIFPYEPKQIFLRAGGNDLHNGRLPGDVANDFVNFVSKIRSRLPNAEILYIAVSPAPARWGEKDKNRALNELIQTQTLRMSHVGYVDAYNMTLDADARARKELFVDDLLHFNADGYKLLAACVRPYLSTSN